MRMLLGAFSKHWIPILAISLIGTVTVQWNLISEKNNKLRGQTIAIQMLNTQLQEHQAKANVMDKIRRAMHQETLNLRSTLRQKSQDNTQRVKGIMQQSIGSDKERSFRWLQEQVNELNWAEEL